MSQILRDESIALKSEHHSITTAPLTGYLPTVGSHPLPPAPSFSQVIQPFAATHLYNYLDEEAQHGSRFLVYGKKTTAGLTSLHIQSPTTKPTLLNIN